jgi:N-acetylglucosamine kinase-like BadF-type ATPase
MAKYFLGIDVGGTKTHALVADDTGQALGFGGSGPGSWEGVGYDGLTRALGEASGKALEMAGIGIEGVAGAGMGLAGFDWPSQQAAHMQAIAPLGLQAPVKIVNDATLGIVAGSSEGWGISVGSGTGCNCRGWSRDHSREGRVVGGASHWSGEYAGGWDIIMRAMQAVTFEWTRRGPATALTPVFLAHTGARDLDDLVEGVYVGRYGPDASLVLDIFQTAVQGDAEAIEVIRWAGRELGGMAVGVIRQLELEKESFEVVLIGSIFDGHPLLAESLGETVHAIAPGARLVRLAVPPAVGGVLLGMEAAGLDFLTRRERLIRSTDQLMNGK